MTGFVDTDDVEVLGGDLVHAHVAGHALAGEHATRVLGHRDRAGHVVRTAVTVRRALGAEVVTLDGAGETLTDGRALHVHLLAHCEQLGHGQHGTGCVFGSGVSVDMEFLDDFASFHACFRKVTTQNLDVIRVDEARQLLMIKGAVPGSAGGFVTVRPAVKSKGAN